MVCQGVTWQCYDAREYLKPHPRFEWCADGDGMLVLKKTRKGYQLLDQRRMVGAIVPDLKAAIEKGTEHMKSTNLDLYVLLGGMTTT